jgi:hypothetical protein
VHCEKGGQVEKLSLKPEKKGFEKYRNCIISLNKKKTSPFVILIKQSKTKNERNCCCG